MLLVVCRRSYIQAKFNTRPFLTNTGIIWPIEYTGTFLPCITASGTRKIRQGTLHTMSDSPIPGEGGKCGYQHGMEPCLPMQGRVCCSVNGWVNWMAQFPFQACELRLTCCATVGIAAPTRLSMYISWIASNLRIVKDFAFTWDAFSKSLKRIFIWLYIAAWKAPVASTAA